MSRGGRNSGPSSDRGRRNDHHHDRPHDHVVDKVERKAVLLDRAAARAERAAAKLTQKAEQIDELSARLASLDLWTRPEPGARRPRFTRDDIAAAAVRIADTEGFDALSMRRLAVELDAGTMTLYHYVRTKDELLALLNDAVMGEVIVPPGELPLEWRPAITAIARRSREAIRRHTWVLDIADDPAPGPNGARHFDQSMQAVASLDAPLAERIELVSAVDEYVFGYSMSERQNSAATSKPDSGMIDYIDSLIDSGDYPTLSAMREVYGLIAAWTEIERVFNDPGRFDRNLARLLDGFEADFARRRSR